MYEQSTDLRSRNLKSKQRKKRKEKYKKEGSKEKGKVKMQTRWEIEKGEQKRSGLKGKESGVFGNWQLYLALLFFLSLELYFHDFVEKRKPYKQHLVWG